MSWRVLSYNGVGYPSPGRSELHSAKAQGPLAREAVGQILEMSVLMDAEFPSKDSMKYVLIAL